MGHRCGGCAGHGKRTDRTASEQTATGETVLPGRFLEGRSSFTATLLPDGRVLVVGHGATDGSSWEALTSAEIWDPSTLAFEPAGEMAKHRYGHTAAGREEHTATLLADGRVALISGVVQSRPLNQSTVIDATELWDPATQAFSKAGRLLEPRTLHTAVPLHDGSVLVLGGEDTDHEPLATAELWRPPALADEHPRLGPGAWTAEDARPRYHRHVPEQASIPAFPGADAVTGRVPAPKTAKRSSRTRKGSAPPVLVEVHRGQTVESRHRGHIVVVDAAGKVQRAVGAPGTEVLLRSTVKPFGVVALIESGAADDLALTPAELAIMCASHTGEDKHVRTLQAIFRRASVTQTLLRCGTDGAPSDSLTATRLARDGETPGPVRHGCSGFHAASILMSAYAGWPLDEYTDPRHPSQKAVRETVARLFGRKVETLKVAPDNCGLLTYEVTLLELARAYLLLADPEGPTADGARAESAAALRRVRDAMMGAPEMVGGTYDNLDTDLMRRRPGRLVAKAGADGMRAVGLVGGDGSGAAGIAIKIEDGDMSRRATKAASVEVLAQVGLLDERDLRAMSAFHHPRASAPDGTDAATALPRFELPSPDEPS